MSPFGRFLLVAAAALAAARSPVYSQTQVTLQPTSDLAHTACVASPNSTWGTFYLNLDDQPVGSNDGDTSYVRSNNVTGSYTCGYESGQAGTVTQVVLHYEAHRLSAAGSIQAQLYNGATLVGTGTNNALTTTYTEYTDTFTGLSISDLNNLQTKFNFSNPSGSSSVRISAVWLTATVTPKLSFVINNSWLAGVQGIAHPTGVSSPSGSFLADHFFNNTKSIVFTNNPSTNPIPAGYTAFGGMKFPGYAGTTAGNSAFQPTLTAGTIDSHVSVVIYDNEYWGNSGETPANEMANPASFTAQFASLAHAHGYRMCASPSRDLAEGQSNYPGLGTLDQYYFTVDQVPTWVATAPSDYFGIQMQVHTTDGGYAGDISSACTQAYAANESGSYFGVLSTTYGTATDLFNAVVATHTDQNLIGYWINSPGGTTAYQEVVDFLYQLYQAGY